ncbi:LysR family transcriptional regulator [Erythrobacter alti]|uniref:LysR family transcriptional regulator n=1 Tax=Erythrobacter alti TaxID=1896145 RepID=UPI0030F45D94
MDLAQIRTFLAAAESGSFSSAAEIVHASASSVTDRIAVLEARLGAPLFHRSRKGCALTEAGERFLPRARSIEEIWQLGHAEAAIPARFSGIVRIGGQYALWPQFLIPWIARLQEREPQLSLQLTAGASARLNRDLAGRGLDLAIVYSPVIGPGVESRPILNDRLILVRPPALPDWRESWVDIDWGKEMRDGIAASIGPVDSRGLVLDLGGMAVTWLIERQCAGYVPERLAQSAIAEGRLVQVVDLPQFDFAAHAVWRSRSDVAILPLVESLLDFVAEQADLPAPA